MKLPEEMLGEATGHGGLLGAGEAAAAAGAGAGEAVYTADSPGRSS